MLYGFRRTDYGLPTAITPNVKDRASFMTFSGMGGAHQWQYQQL